MFGFSDKKKIRVALEPSQRVIAIGDIHGQIDRLTTLMEQVDSYREDNPVEDEAMVFLGDFADRGPLSAEVINYLSDRRKQSKKQNHREVFLKGNHEQLMIETLSGDLTRAELWWKNGGKETAYSYARFCGFSLEGKDIHQSLTLMRDHFPKAHAKFYNKLDLLYRKGPLLFVHAGIRMDKSIKDQNEEDLMWIRAPFLDYSGPKRKFMVVHGHTIMSGFKPEITPHRISIDTGSYRKKGKITAAIFENNKVRFLESGTTTNFKSSPFD
ncbi:metallophosphoesterase family protein [Sneathiella aquimaris]|uniref:metallophosphoesterase family protein n=1 Tax=Sneathiella aquimaris TaxID=2599305 RepID=UPI00146F0573|nr:metallophosphoesterase family protein [Sneathiella aquimaris]